MPGNFVAFPERPVENAAADFGIARATIACVQFLTKRSGLVGMATGDSHHQGTSTTTQFLNFLLRSIVTLGSRYVGRVPFGYVSTAVGGATSEQFFATMLSLLPAIRPSFVVLPGWTFNDQDEMRFHQDLNTVFMARLIQAVETCNMSNVVPILLTPFPRDARSMTTNQVQQWLMLRRAVLMMADSGAIVVDATSILGRKTTSKEFDGTYLPGLSTDGAHPNDDGHAALARALVIDLETLAGMAGSAI